MAGGHQYKRLKQQAEKEKEDAARALEAKKRRLEKERELAFEEAKLSERCAGVSARACSFKNDLHDAAMTSGNNNFFSTNAVVSLPFLSNPLSTCISL